jgi:hypothetical protein
MNRLIFVVVAMLVALASSAVAHADRGVRPAEPAGSYMASIVKQKLDNDYASAWQTLYPPHQRVASLEAYVACESLVPSPGTLVGVRVLRTFNERIRVAGALKRVRTRAVRVRVSVSLPDFPLFPVVVDQTFHAVAVKRHWRWILSPDQYANYSAGVCPYS